MKKCLLVHGAWHNESCWDGVKERLIKAGVEVFTVSLAGNEVGAVDVDTTYKAMVQSLIQKAESIEGTFILVGHSSAGHIIQQAAPKIANKIDKIIFNNAWLLPDGLSQFDLVPDEIKDGMRMGAKHNERHCVPLDEGFLRNVLASNTAVSIQDSLISILVPQPIMMLEEKADAKAFLELKTPMAFLHCTQDISLPPDTYKNMFLGLNKGDEVVEIEGVHECLYTDPELFVEGLMKLI